MSFGVRGASWMFIFIYFIKFGKLSAIISSNALFPSFSLLQILWWICWSTWKCNTSPLVRSFFFSLFSFYSSDEIISIVLSSYLLILLHPDIFSTFSFSSLSIFKKAPLKSSSNKSTISSLALRIVSGDFLFSSNGPNFPVSPCASLFYCCWKQYLNEIMQLWKYNSSPSPGFAGAIFTCFVLVLVNQPTN